MQSSSLESAWSVLDSVRWKQTQWQIVYEPEELRVHFRTRKHRAIRTISLKEFSEGCDEAVPVLSMQEPVSGQVSDQFRAYDPKQNLTLVETGIARLDADLPRRLVEVVADYPSRLQCAE
tara:strand:- start:134 stop:493 length:360 start_codon:yes stop_codon:yes gene_type:complete